VSLVDFVLSLVLIAGLLIWYHLVPSWRIVFLPAFVLMAFATAIGAGLWFGALNVKYRDFRYIIPFLVQFGLYVSPVGFSSSIVPERWRLIYSANPMAGVIDGIRWATFGQSAHFYLPGFALSLVLVLGLLVTGAWYFRRVEKTFADVI
jgi:lipopolysaccharide transport system permease protein